MEKQFKLPKPFAIKWLEALRSGDYDQATESLAKFKLNGLVGYCCIGVAGCLLGAPTTQLEHFQYLIGKGKNLEENPYCLEIDCPVELQGSPTKNQLVAKLVDMNDSQQLSFNEIADWIERNVEFYETV